MTDDTTGTAVEPATDRDPGTVLHPAEARASLRQVDEVSVRTARQARWWVLFMAVFALGFGALTLLVGTAEGPRDLIAPMVAFGALTVGMTGIALSRPVQGGFSYGVFLTGWLGTSVLYGIALGAGIALGLPLWGWVVAAVVVAAPLAVSAWLTHRSLA